MPTNGQWLEALFRTNRESLYLSNLFQLTIFSLNFGNFLSDFGMFFTVDVFLIEEIALLNIWFSLSFFETVFIF